MALKVVKIICSLRSQVAFKKLNNNPVAFASRPRTLRIICLSPPVTVLVKICMYIRAALWATWRSLRPLESPKMSKLLHISGMLYTVLSVEENIKIEGQTLSKKTNSSLLTEFRNLTRTISSLSQICRQTISTLKILFLFPTGAKLSILSNLIIRRGLQSWKDNWNLAEQKAPISS